MPQISKLEQWLLATAKPGETRNARFARFASQVDVSLHCVRKWVYGQRTVDDISKIKIEKLTNGKVTIEDMVRQSLAFGLLERARMRDSRTWCAHKAKGEPL